MKLPKITLATKITLLRMLSVPFVLWALYEARYALALGIFAVAAVSDGVDGYIARKFGQQSVLGAILDPLADKFLLTLTFITLTASPNTLVAFPAWLTVAVTYRDLLIMTGSGIVKWFCPAMQFRPIVSSKLTTFFQITTALVVVLANLLKSFHHNPDWLTAPIHVLAIITGVFCAVSVLGYYHSGVWMLATEGEDGAAAGGAAA
ncbi:MAG: CDP-alcohol phosphatidyltransferase family protein [Candidatus Sumerlaeia bacterium]|nr:CDP-alcohol phosphatidyltransferase family protein [Candidatus Sumerlaeia bacterium]